jgi:regulator of cell morphogenesis and NO signaling
LLLKNLPDLVFYTQKIANVHGENHPELIEVADLFAKINDELLQHLKNEEEVLFPAIKEVVATNSQRQKKQSNLKLNECWVSTNLPAEQWIILM